MSDHLDLDLDIGNYTIKDLETFFQLKPRLKYTSADIEEKEYKIREQLLSSGHINKRFKRDLIEFLTLAKDWLIHVKCKPFERQPSVIPKNYKLDTMNTPKSAEIPNRTEELIHHPATPYINTMQSDFYPSNMNPLNTRVLTKCLNIDTRFRDNIHSTSSSDFIVQLPDKFNKVVSMQLASLELPVSFYGISSGYGNNFLRIKVVYDVNKFSSDNTQNEYINKKNTIYYINFSQDPDIVNPASFSSPSSTYRTIYATFVVPDGNYSAADLILKLNLLLCPLDQKNEMQNINNIFSYIQFVLDINQNGSGSGKVTIAPISDFLINKYKGSSNINRSIVSLNLDFTQDKTGLVDNIDISFKLGWNLGFQQRQYLELTTYTGETIIEPSNIRYIYLVVDDYNNNVNNHFVSAFNKSILGPNILARISMKGASFSLMMENDFNMITEPRRYFGPVDIQKLKIQLIDEYGKPLQMNNSDYSFCINLKMLYDL